MNIQEIRAAVGAGKTVNWKTGAYRVIEDRLGRLLVVSSGDCWPFEKQDGTMINAEEKDFALEPVTPKDKPVGAPSDSERLAIAFSTKMQIAVTGETLHKIIIKNRSRGCCEPCASHDHCDAAEVMREAWESLWSEPFNWESALVEHAWRIAQRNEFGF